MLRPLLIVLVKGPPIVVLVAMLVYACDLAGARQPMADAFTAAANKVGVHMAERIAPAPSPRPSPAATPAPSGG